MNEGQPFNFSPKSANGLDIGYVVYKMVPVSGCSNEETMSNCTVLAMSTLKTSVVVSDEGVN